LRVAKNKPTAKQKTSAYKIKRGNKTTLHSGLPLKIKYIIKKINKEIMKSIKLTNMEDAGKIIFGKYTLVRIFELFTNELLTSVIPVEISCHKITPHETVKNRSS
jgi:hypothetical protein